MPQSSSTLWCARASQGDLPHDVQVLRWLLAAHGFEQFLSRKFPASKRFGLEGCEALLPGLLALVETCAESGLRKVSGWQAPGSTPVSLNSAAWRRQTGFSPDQAARPVSLVEHGLSMAPAHRHSMQQLT